ncbi:MAG: 4-aminobutyrate aminotransferase [Thermomicrobiales bacterium]|nr:4-aminobutyrate aminotransferase [Thermomicrobiales bacterium]
MIAADVIERDRRFVADALKIRYFPFVLDRGEGPYLFDVEGRRYLDFGAGWALAGLGYSNEYVRNAITRQLDRTMYGGLLSGINQPAVALAEKLVSLVPGDFEKKAWFGLSGSDASEAAQRLILRATGRKRVISFIGSWHGTTDATMGLSAHPSLAAVGSGAHVTKIPYPNPYRNPFGEGSGQVTDQCLGFLENYLFKTICPPEDVAAIFAEAVQSDGGDVVPPPDFMPKLRALCDRYGILLVVDEIKVGLGRTGRWFSYEHGDVAADVVLLGKSLGGGLPLSAIVARKEILDVGTGLALFTTAGNATSCAAGLATVEVIEQEGLVERSAENGRYLNQRLTEALAKYEIVGDVRGLGMIQGVELVTDRTSKEPNQPAAAKIVYRAFELGLIVYYAGNWGNVLEITPPLILTRDEIDEGVAILDQAIADVLDGQVSDEKVAQFAGW